MRPARRSIVSGRLLAALGVLCVVCVLIGIRWVWAAQQQQQAVDELQRLRHSTAELTGQVEELSRKLSKCRSALKLRKTQLAQCGAEKGLSKGKKDTQSSSNSVSSVSGGGGVVSAALQNAVPVWLIGRHKECNVIDDNADTALAACRIRSAIFERLDALHNSRLLSSCPVSPKDVIGCDLEYATGLGHHLHHVGHCLTFALMHNKPVVMYDHMWSYARECTEKSKWNCFFEPFNKLCAALKGTEASPAVSSRRTVDGNFPEKYLTWGASSVSNYWVPPDLEENIKKVHVDPPLFVKGLLMEYFYTLKDEYVSLVRDQAQTMKITRPYAALHVRRGDKIGTEAQLHHLWEYMEHVDNFFERIEYEGSGKPFVFVATDEPNLMSEAKAAYGNRYEFVAVNGAASMAAAGFGSIKGMAAKLTMTDIAWLANADFLVGTFSSQISRIAFELMTAVRPTQTYIYPNPKPEESCIVFKGKKKPFQVPNPKHKHLFVRAVSLDDGYYYGNM